MLHKVKLISDEADSVVVNASEGLLKIPKAILPPGFVDTAAPFPTPKAEPGMVMMPFNPNPMNSEAQDDAKPTPKPVQKPTPMPSSAPNPVFKGCVITSFTPKPFQSLLGCAEVVFQNTTEAPVVINPGDVTCAVATGRPLRGRQFVVDAFPPIIKRRDVVPEEGSLDVMVVFANDALEISEVRWTR